MMKGLFSLVAVLILFFLAGCAPSSTVRQNKEEQQEALKSLGAIATVISGQEMGEKELKALGKQIQKNPEAQSAVKSITDSMTGENIIIKYCPLTGKRYASHLTVCPEHQVALEILEH